MLAEAVSLGGQVLARLPHDDGAGARRSAFPCRAWPDRLAVWLRGERGPLVFFCRSGGQCEGGQIPAPARLSDAWHAAGGLTRQWPPEQIAGWLKQLFAGHHEYRVSHETIYRSLYIQIATLVERQTRSVMLAKVEGKDTETVVNALIDNAGRLSRELYKSLFWNRGKEMGGHKRFTLATDIKVYFCDPKSPWQRGSNENTNGLLRQYFPKGLDLSTYFEEGLDEVGRKLNERPRKTLNYQTLAQRFEACVAWTD